MKRLKDFKDEINKCSKCGLCQSVCPVFKETLNDCAVSKGKFVMLDGVLKGDLKLSKNINKYLDMCLKCGKCKDFCPSNIDVCTIFESAKYEYAKDTILGKFIFFLQSEFVFGNVLKFISKILRPMREDIRMTGVGADMTTKLLYFRGCAGKVFRHTDKILGMLDKIDVIEHDFDCCGIPFLSSGNVERYERAKKHNMELIQSSDFDYILTDCASCESSLKDYFESSSNMKFISLGELLVKCGAKFKSDKHLRVTFHKPCHLDSSDFVKPLFDKIENVEYLECDGFDDCCGFAGEFALKNRKLSDAISYKKAQNIINTFNFSRPAGEGLSESGQTDIVITTCPSCILGLKQGLRHFKNPPKVMSLSEFIYSLSKVNK